jgi:regulator of sirC expression with transglutaminase-like and TPR domain
MSQPAAESGSRQRFALLANHADEDVGLAEAALLIACEEYPALEVKRYLGQLDLMGATLASRLPRDRAPEAAVLALNEYLFQEQGFRGNTDAYYDPRNSFLNDVLDRRIGIPISLSAVYMEVARRAGIEAFGVGLPGHFVVRLAGAGHTLLVDPFHGGAVLTEDDCQRRLDRIFGGRVRMEPRMLDALAPRAILERMLRNLKAIYAKEEDHPRTLSVLELLLLLVPGSLADLRDRGLAYASLDCYALAARDLTDFLARCPPKERTAELVSTLETQKRRAARVN